MRFSESDIDRIFERDEIRDFFWQNVNWCILAFDKDGIIIDANNFFLAQFGYDRDEVVNHPFIEFVHPDDRESTLRIERDNVPKQTFVYGKKYFENRYVQKSGDYKVLRWYEGDGIYLDSMGHYIGYAKMI